jgi:hypothetical protein
LEEKEVGLAEFPRPWKKLGKASGFTGESTITTGPIEDFWNALFSCTK